MAAFPFVPRAAFFHAVSSFYSGLLILAACAAPGGVSHLSTEFLASIASSSSAIRGCFGFWFATLFRVYVRPLTVASFKFLLTAAAVQFVAAASSCTQTAAAVQLLRRFQALWHCALWN